MHYLLCKIWRSSDGCSREGSPVNPQNDKVRAAYDPNATLVHTFQAYSDHDFFRQVDQWDRQVDGWDGRTWQPDPAYPEHFFTEVEVAE